MHDPPRSYLITGGAGFIGANAARHLLGRGERVTVLDNLSRPGADANLEWLRAAHGELSVEVADVRDPAATARCARDADVILHLASQVAVTASVDDPRTDFEVNALGTLNVLEAARASPRRPVVIYASTNKVYGAMSDLEVVAEPRRYRYADLPHGVDESRPLDFHSPYGCSKGCGDQYVRDYHRIFGLRSVVLRQSCIYGPRQFGVEDQGWVAWLVIAAVTGRPITIYGDGKQVRDLLHVHDLVRCFDRAVERIDRVSGQVFNIGGGPGCTLAVWTELGPLLEQLLARPLAARHGPWRPADQRVFISDIRRARRALDWHPTIPLRQGLEELVGWVTAHRELVESLL
jgi:CDP-paratose 2-epimerase